MATVAMQPAVAADSHSFDIPVGRLGDAVVMLGRQGGVTIGVSDAALAEERVSAVRGRMPVAEAIRRLLSGTLLSVVAIDARSFRIARARVPSPPVASGGGARSDPPPPADIVVIASKRETRLGDFPGTISILGLQERGIGRRGDSGTDALVNALPSLGSTHLGPGRNKLIIRGVADSSFTGPTQAIVGQYLGDIRLNYNAPDPDLNLYDIDRVEVLEGPQGTLYGAGSLGGIVRLVSSAPDLSTFAGSMAAGLLTTRGGAAGRDVAAMANVPLLEGKIGLRAVGYWSVDGGYIDDVGRGLSNVNRSRTEGGRVTLRIAPGDDWTIDIGGTLQNINNADSQYAERGLPPFTRSSTFAQPFDNDYLLGQIVISKHWNAISLVSATGIVRHDVTARYDATPVIGTPAIFRQENYISLISNENRLSRHAPDGSGWVIGTSMIVDTERLTRSLGAPANLVRTAGLRNSITEGAIYGEGSLGVARGLTVTAGGRVAYNRLAGEVLDIVIPEGTEPRRTEVEVLPSLAVTWRPTGRLTAFARYQEGFRPGGLSVGASGSGLSSQRFKGDNVATVEAGLRLGEPMRDRFSVSASISYSHWESIQADLVDSGGLPFTANIGTGTVLGFETAATWRVAPGLIAEAGLFLNDSTLNAPAPDFVGSDKESLPNVAGVSGRGAISYQTAIGEALSLSVNASFRYFGHSRLGVGPVLNISQGDYLETALGGRLGTERLGMSLDLTNLFNREGNRFSLGDPFGVMAGRQITPQRPRTIRLGFDVRF